MLVRGGLKWRKEEETSSTFSSWRWRALTKAEFNQAPPKQQHKKDLTAHRGQKNNTKGSAKPQRHFMMGFTGSTQTKTLGKNKGKKLDPKSHTWRHSGTVWVYTWLWTLKTGSFLCNTVDWIKPDQNTYNIWKYIHSEMHFTAFINRQIIRSYPLDFLLLSFT